MTRERMISEKPSRRPGNTPAMNSALIEIVPPVASEYSTALWLGGTSSACTDEVMGRLVANTRGETAFSICGIMTDPMADVSATAEPEMPLRNVVASTLKTEEPPRQPRKATSASAK